jgi:acetate kinase
MELLASMNTIAEKESLVLTVNGGSSSIKFAVFTSSPNARRLMTGQAERIGLRDARLVIKASQASQDTSNIPILGISYDDAIDSLLDLLQKRFGTSGFSGIGHRIVHGGANLIDHQLVTPLLVDELKRIEALDMAHLPAEIALIERLQQAFPETPHIACFDTVFHQSMPRVAQLLPIPRRYLDSGVRRFGFHGLSYTYLMKQLAVLAGPKAAYGRIVLCHLGSGASMAAVSNGHPLDTTMAFTPTAGLVMGTRPGDIDPGLLLYLMKNEMLTCEQMELFISHRCGLLGVSESSSDMRDLLRSCATDTRAAEAIDLFCYQAKKHLGALSVALGGLDTIVFSGGIGENVPEIRARICDGLEFLGVRLDSQRNAQHAGVISTDQSRVTIRMIPTDEEKVMVEIVLGLLSLPTNRS